MWGRRWEATEGALPPEAFGSLVDVVVADKLFEDFAWHPHLARVGHGPHATAGPGASRSVHGALAFHHAHHRDLKPSRYVWNSVGSC